MNRFITKSRDLTCCLRVQIINLSSDSVVVYVDEVSLRRPLFVPRRVGEPLAEDDAEADVVAASSPLEFAGRRFVRQRTATALRRCSRAARLGDRLRQRGSRQRVHVRLFSTSCSGIIFWYVYLGQLESFPFIFWRWRNKLK